jgi:hypothetical protein
MHWARQFPVPNNTQTMETVGCRIAAKDGHDDIDDKKKTSDIE